MVNLMPKPPDYEDDFFHVYLTAALIGGRGIVADYIQTHSETEFSDFFFHDNPLLH